MATPALGTDHVYHFIPSRLILVYYVDFATFHQHYLRELVALCAQQHFVLVVRHLVPDFLRAKVPLSGYGIELSLKNTGKVVCAT